MSRLDKLLIQGIRSFDDKQHEVCLIDEIERHLTLSRSSSSSCRSRSSSARTDAARRCGAAVREASLTNFVCRPSSSACATPRRAKCHRTVAAARLCAIQVWPRSLKSPAESSSSSETPPASQSLPRARSAQSSIAPRSRPRLWRTSSSTSRRAAM